MTLNGFVCADKCAVEVLLRNYTHSINESILCTLLKKVSGTQCWVNYLSKVITNYKVHSQSVIQLLSAITLCSCN